MDDKYTVFQWIWISRVFTHSGYGWDFVWAGDNHKTAIKEAKMAKLRGAGCVRIEWR